MSDARLKSLADRINRLMDERDGIASDIRDLYAEAKSVGYIPKALRKAIARMRMDPDKLAEDDSLLDLYEAALGRVGTAMQAVRAGATVEAAAKANGIDRATLARARAVAKQRENATVANHDEIATPPHDAETGELVDDGGEPETGIPVSADVPRETEPESAASRALRWAATSRTGVSSLAIMSMMRGEAPQWHSYPHNAGDFGRCEGLLDAVPEWRERMGEMAAVGPEWAALAEHWPELSAMHSAGDHDGVYRRIGELVRPLEAKRRNVVQIGEGARIIMPDDAPDPGPIPDFLRRDRATA